MEFIGMNYIKNIISEFWLKIKYFPPGFAEETQYLSFLIKTGFLAFGTSLLFALIIHDFTHLFKDKHLKIFIGTKKIVKIYSAFYLFAIFMINANSPSLFFASIVFFGWFSICLDIWLKITAIFRYRLH